MSGCFVRQNPEGSAAGFAPFHMAAKEDFATDDKIELIDNLFATEDEKLLCRAWVCAPCREQIDACPVHELMSVISGSVTLTDPDGNPDTFTAGDVFFIPKGTPVAWEIIERLRKFDMIAE